MSGFGSQKLGGLLAKANKEDLILLRELIQAGKVTLVIDRRSPRAIRYLEEGHARGKVAITCGDHKN